MSRGGPWSVMRSHRPVVVALAVGLLLVTSSIGLESAAAYTRSRLAVSWNADRSQPVRLDGGTVKGKIYVFARNAWNFQRADFYLDDPLRKRAPIHSDYQRPFDFAGTADNGTALPYDTVKLTDGSHSITVVLRSSNGNTTSHSATFTVANGGAVPNPTPTSAPPTSTSSPTTAAPTTAAPTTAAPTTAAPTTAAPTTAAPTTTAPPSPVPSGSRPSAPPAQICGNTSLLSGPATAPAGAIIVPAGDNSGLTANWNANGFSQAGKTFWFAPGIHTIGSNEFDQIQLGSGSTYVGGPGAIIDGQLKNLYAFAGKASNVTIKHLTIRNFGTGASNNDEATVNHDGGTGWTITHNLVVNNDGAGVALGPRSVTTYNCLKDNGQYGFTGFAGANTSGGTNALLDHNEISGNNTDDWEARRAGCGCTGGGKFWENEDVVVSNNYVHGNHGVGIWADFNNRGFLIENNWIENNDAHGIEYETSYNFLIRNNVLIGNAVVMGKTRFGGVGNTFPAPAIYISESGGDTRAGDTYTTSEIYGNLLQDNWDGIALWENADRYCRPGVNDTAASCPFFDENFGARNRTQNVKIHDNEFRFTKASVGCTNTLCGRNSLFSNWGVTSTYSGDVIQQAITFNQNNKWYNNAYYGEWHFQPWDMGTDKTFAQWQASPYSQDAGSTYQR